LQNSPLESSCVVVALVENYSNSKPLKISPEKSQILSYDTVVANERYVRTNQYGFPVFYTMWCDCPGGRGGTDQEAAKLGAK
jgi:hypothetical protein